MDKKKNQRALSSYDAEEVGSAARSQLRKRFDLGDQSSATPTQPSVLRPTPIIRRDPRADESTANTRPTIPTPRPRIGMACIPRRVVTDTELMALPLDNRAAFVLMHIDGRTNLRSLIDVTGMVPEEVVAMVERLLEMSAIALV